MAFGSFGDGAGSSGGAQPMSEINTTPLVDVMLVLLVIFIITAPLLTHGIRIDLPKASSSANPEKPETVTLSLDADGHLFWNDKPVPDDQMEAQMAAAAKQQPVPEMHIRADRNTRYQRLAEIMSAARRAGLTKLGFVTDPSPAGSAAAGVTPVAAPVSPAQ
ncbi:MAG: biopolymer transporter ExbD [Burkholderiales bacterium]|nr:biopolymer transporter ExbD [Burkholderiales bacterium]